jgi:hypothetical protein
MGRLWLRTTSVHASAKEKVCNVTTIIEKTEKK